ncbi:MAG: hypothetical protein JWM00_476 [Candidatus Saccharibacteria bacterium]|nr:hypothetical protein [Candidatus Saccharibacteria bacterium]
MSMTSPTQPPAKINALGWKLATVTLSFMFIVSVTHPVTSGDYSDGYQKGVEDTCAAFALAYPNSAPLCTKK